MNKQLFGSAAVLVLVVVVLITIKPNTKTDSNHPADVQAITNGAIGAAAASTTAVNSKVLTPVNSQAASSTFSSDTSIILATNTTVSFPSMGPVFDSLPADMQAQITDLSGRQQEPQELVRIEVAAGKYITPMPKQIRIVPVAVTNEDGTVSIHEF